MTTDIPPVRDEWECIDLQCSHYDGDQCTLGGCFDPPEEDDEFEPEPSDKWQPEYEHWLEGGEHKGDIDREDGITRGWLPIQDDEEVANGNE